MLVSVIIPCYNVENYISECIDSVLNQTYRNIEIICIDNNSSDNTWKLLQELKPKYPQIILDKELNPGAPSARNKGLNLAKGEWIQFLDADDLLLPNKIEHQINLIQKASIQIAYIVGACKIIHVNSKKTIVTEFKQDKYIAPFINMCGNTCSNLWNKAAVLYVGMWNENVKSSQETDLMLRLILNDYDFIIDNTPLTIIRQRISGQISQRNPQEKWAQYINIRLSFLEKMKNKNNTIYNKYKSVYYNFLMITIIELSKTNKIEALKIYNESIKNKWDSSSNYYGFSKIKFILIKTIGLNLFLKLNKLQKIFN